MTGRNDGTKNCTQHSDLSIVYIFFFLLFSSSILHTNSVVVNWRVFWWWDYHTLWPSGGCKPIPSDYSCTGSRRTSRRRTSAFLKIKNDGILDFGFLRTGWPSANLKTLQTGWGVPLLFVARCFTIEVKHCQAGSVLLATLGALETLRSRDVGSESRAETNTSSTRLPVSSNCLNYPVASIRIRK